MAAWQIRLSPVGGYPGAIETTLMEVFGSWLPLLFDLGAVSLAGGLLVKEIPQTRS